MKKSLKILFAVLAVALVCSIVGIYVIAASAEEQTSEMTLKANDPDGYMYQIFTPSDGKITKYTDASTFVDNFKSAKDGAVITLLSNCTISKSIPTQSNKTVYFDLNGYTFYQALGSNTAVTIATDATLYVYSSDNGYTARMIASFYKEGAEKTITLFRMQRDNSYLQVGAVSTSHFSSQIGVWWACVFLTALGPAGGLHMRLLLAPGA